MIRPLKPPCLLPKQRLPRRKAVTLVCAWKCLNSMSSMHDAYVIHADSQESTETGYRVSVQKIMPDRIGSFEMLVSGSGIGTLVKAFIIRLKRRLRADLPTDVDQFIQAVESELERFYEHDIALYPASNEDDKALEFLVAAAFPEKGQCGAWTTEHIILRPIEDCELLGWKIDLYKHISKRFYAPEMSIAQAFLAGIYLCSVAEETSNYIKGPLSVAIVWPGSITMQDGEYIASTAKRLKDYERRINALFLECADSSVPVDKLQETLSEFSSSALLLHRYHLDQIVNSMRLEDAIAATDVLQKIPIGSPVSLRGDGTLSIEHDKEIAEQARRTLRQLIEETDEAIKRLASSRGLSF
jgi:hypothetical protein